MDSGFDEGVAAGEVDMEPSIWWSFGSEFKGPLILEKESNTCKSGLLVIEIKLLLLRARFFGSKGFDSPAFCLTFSTC